MTLCNKNCVQFFYIYIWYTSVRCSEHLNYVGLHRDVAQGSERTPFTF